LKPPSQQKRYLVGNLYIDGNDEINYRDRRTSETDPLATAQVLKPCLFRLLPRADGQGRIPPAVLHPRPSSRLHHQQGKDRLIKDAMRRSFVHTKPSTSRFSFVERMIIMTKRPRH
jgi:hypothetical protein